MAKNKVLNFIQKFFKSIGKFFLYILFWAYFSTCSFIAYDWAKIKWYGMVPYQNLERAIQYQRNKGDVDEAIFIYNNRTKSEYKENLETMVPLAPQLEPMFYFIMAKQYTELKNYEEAFFWTQLGLFRTTYDALRCIDGQKTILQVKKIIFNYSIPDGIKAMLDDNESDLFLFTMQRVLDWDKENPPQARPDYYCKMVAKLDKTLSDEATPEENWYFPRDSLRMMTKVHLDNLNFKRLSKDTSE